MKLQELMILKMNIDAEDFELYFSRTGPIIKMYKRIRFLSNNNKNNVIFFQLHIFLENIKFHFP